MPNPAIQKLAAARPPAWTRPLADCISGLQISPHGHTCLVTSLSGDLACLEVKTGKIRWEAAAHRTGALWVSIHPTEPWVASGGQDGTVKIWEANKGTLLHTLTPPKRNWVEAGGWSADGHVLAAASGKRVYFWDSGGQFLGETTEHAGTVLCLDWHPRESLLLTGSKGGVFTFAPDQAEPVDKTPWSGVCLSVKWSPDGRFIAAGNQDQTVHAWPTGTMDHLRMAGYATKLRELAWSCDSGQLFTGGGYNVITWNFRGAGPSGSTPLEQQAHAEFITALAPHPLDPKLVASTGQDQFLFVWQDTSETPVWVRVLPGGPATTLQWNPAGEMLLAGCANGEVYSWKFSSMR